MNIEVPTGPVTYIDAIRQAMLEEMHRDENVFLIGEDIANFGGAFKATKGLVDIFGPQRVIDTPIGESGILGLSIGASMMGMRPIAEMQFADFVTCGYTQLVEQAAKNHYRWGQANPIVVRLPSGGGLGAGPFHSCNPEAWFLNIPGLKMVAPSTPNDARGLLKAAVRDNNPVLFLEHKFLYRRAKDVLTPGDDIVPIGKGKVVRSGRDLTIVTYHSMVQFSVEAADELAAEGFDIEVIDLRSLVPWDKELVQESVSRTNRVLIVHEATRTGGYGAEIAATIAEENFKDLDAPVARVASIDTPVPFAPPLEKYFLPNKDKIAAKARELLEF
ncbi:MAG: alpha-ketoacid dehydrogenase subunit beta [Bdellovibrionales bacterium]|nr:alpha-ketoacid dehydrogenase subunit beta [Bdellovibrionales bacterium]